MANIITMTSKEFLKKFTEKYDHKNFQFLLVSEDIRSEGKYKNSYCLKSLIPPPNIISEFVNNGYSDKYKKKYLEYLSMPKVEPMLTVMVKLAAIDKTDVILLCSENESQYKYLKLISKYLSKVYNINTCTYKEFNKSPKDCDAVSDKKKVIKVLQEKMKDVNPEVIQPTINKSAFKKKLKLLSRKELRAFCENRDIKIKQSDEKEDIIKKIMKQLFKD